MSAAMTAARWAALLAWFGFAVILGLNGPIVAGVHSINSGTKWPGLDLLSHGELYAASLGLAIVTLGRVAAIGGSAWLNTPGGKVMRSGLGVAAGVLLALACIGLADAWYVKQLASSGMVFSMAMYGIAAGTSLLAELFLR